MSSAAPSAMRPALKKYGERLEVAFAFAFEEGGGGSVSVSVSVGFCAD